MLKSEDGSTDWQTIGLVALLVYVATAASRAVKTIAKTVEKANNFGLTDDEMKAASATLQSSTATVAERQAAVATLKVKIDGAKAAGYGKQVKAADQALQLLDRELAEQAKLSDARRAWEERQKAQRPPLAAVK